MHQKYASNGRVNKKKPHHAQDGIAHSPASGKCAWKFLF